MNTDIFSDTIAEMTWYEVDQAAKDGAVLLWAFGVIEQHGPHLPLGVDSLLVADVPSVEAAPWASDLAAAGK